MDELKLNDQALENCISIIKKYCEKQKLVIEEYEHDIKNLSSSWEGPNFDSIFNRVINISKYLTKDIDSIKERYPKYLNEKIEMFRARPAYFGSSYVSSKSSNTSSLGSGGSKTPKTIYDKIFEKHNKAFVTRLYYYLKRINFYIPDERLSFYDPDGKYKRGLYKNIMAIDLNSDSCEQDLLFLTGQHIYFQMKHEWKMQLIRCMGVDLQNKTWLNDTKFQELSKKIISGTGINNRFLNFENSEARTAFNFFTFAFSDFMADKNDMLNDYKKYFSHSYGQFRELLRNLDYN